MFKVLTDKTTLEVIAFNVAIIQFLKPKTDENGIEYTEVIYNGYVFNAKEKLEEILEQFHN